jgi:hypothetical protein
MRLTCRIPLKSVPSRQHIVLSSPSSGRKPDFFSHPIISVVMTFKMHKTQINAI